MFILRLEMWAETGEGELYPTPQFPQMSVGGQPAWFRVPYR